MSENKNINLLNLYRKYGLDDRQIVNELLRFRVMDQIISSRANSRDWGLTLDELYALAEKSTLDVFGEIAIEKNYFGKCYQQAFSVDLFNFIEETNLMDGIRSGIELKPALSDVIAKIKEIPTGQKVLFAHVEEYASLINAILQELSDYDVILQAETKEANIILRRLYPLANIVVDMPKEEIFDEIVFVHRGYFEDCTKAMIEATFLLANNLSDTGKANFFIESRAFYTDHEQVEEWQDFFAEQGLTNKSWAEMFYSHPRLECITEWLPLYVWQLTISNKEVEKAQVSFKEIIEDKIIEKKMIPLHKQLILEMKYFSLVEYALACGGYLEENKNEDRVYYAWNLEGDIEYPWRRTSEMNPVNTALWVLFFESNKGQQIQEILHTYADTEDGYKQLLLGISRPWLEPHITEELAVSFWEGITNYEKEKAQIEAKWQNLKSDLVAKIANK